MTNSHYSLNLPTTNKETGFKGEQIAKEYLISQQYTILEQNFRYSKSEIDLIAKEGEVLVFIEVKTRSYDYFGPPESFVSEYKEVLIHEAGSYYMEKINHDWEFRFDIIAILLDKDGSYKLEHYKDAF